MRYSFFSAPKKNWFNVNKSANYCCFLREVTLAFIVLLININGLYSVMKVLKGSRVPKGWRDVITLCFFYTKIEVKLSNIDSLRKRLGLNSFLNDTIRATTSLLALLLQLHFLFLCIACGRVLCGVRKWVARCLDGFSGQRTRRRMCNSRLELVQMVKETRLIVKYNREKFKSLGICRTERRISAGPRKGLKDLFRSLTSGLVKVNGINAKVRTLPRLFQVVLYLLNGLNLLQVLGRTLGQALVRALGPDFS